MAFLNMRHLVDIGLLYASKSGAVVVGIAILPWYQRLLGAEGFGMVATILSLQTFLLMIDLGTSTLVGRDISSQQNDKKNFLTWRAAEVLLHLYYGGLLAFVCFVIIFIGHLDKILDAVLSAILFWSLTVQNVGQSALLAKHYYALAGGIQVVGVLGRAAVTLIALIYISSDLKTFLSAQTIAAVLQMLVTSRACRMVFQKNNYRIESKAIKEYMVNLARRGKPLVLFGFSGAAVMQLDKIIIPIFVSPAELTPYFLASAICLTPINILAGPINQYYSPRIIGSISNGDAVLANKQIRSLIISIFIAVSIPSLALWLYRDLIINYWLDNQPVSCAVVQYVAILLPGIALGSLGFAPYNILIAFEDYRAHALLSATMTIVTLSITTWSAASGSILYVCWAYAAYHGISPLLTWLRASYILRNVNNDYASGSAFFVLRLLAALFLFITFPAFYIKLFKLIMF